MLSLSGKIQISDMYPSYRLCPVKRVHIKSNRIGDLSKFLRLSHSRYYSNNLSYIFKISALDTSLIVFAGLPESNASSAILFIES